jgi:hypothetical protein
MTPAAPARPQVGAARPQVGFLVARPWVLYGVNTGATPKFTDVPNHSRRSMERSP